MGRPVVTERDVLDALKQGKKSITIESNTIITAAAKDTAAKSKVQFSIGIQHQAVLPAQPAIPPPSKGTAMKIAIGSDHGGFPMKETIKNTLIEQGHSVVDVGTDSEKACDYPDFAYAVALLVSTGKVERGIMIDGVGVASSIVDNIVPGVRSVPSFDEFVARSSREHNNANMLTLGGKTMGIEVAKSIVKIWLETPFGGGRHQPRVDKIADVEKRFLK
jgi:ribose 5-phosphate isomerase B